MAEGHIHKELKKQALFFLKGKVIDIVANEVKFKNIHCIADAVGINLKRKEIRIIEAKATREDFIRDQKLFHEKTSYFYHAHYSYIICPSGLIHIHEVPFGYGLLWINEDKNIQVKKNPLKNKEKLKTTFHTTLKRSVRRLSNDLLYHTI
jgi:hypothetical protein